MNIGDEKLIKYLNHYLETYKGVLTPQMLEYLESLINLEFSVVRNYISNDERRALSQLELYKKIAEYNIYKRALMLLNKDELRFIDNRFDFKAYYKLDTRDANVFKYALSDKPLSYDNITRNMGEISLFQVKTNDRARYDEMGLVRDRIIKAYEQISPYEKDGVLYKENDCIIILDKLKEIEKYKMELFNLSRSRTLRNEDAKEIEIQNKYHDLFLEDYGLKDKDFMPTFDEKCNDEETYLVRKLKYNIPGLTINNYVRYY